MFSNEVVRECGISDSGEKRVLGGEIIIILRQSREYPFVINAYTVNYKSIYTALSVI